MLEWTHVLPRGDAKAGSLAFASGVAPRLVVRGAAMPDLARASLPDPAPRVVATGDEITIDYRGFFRWLFGGAIKPGLVELTDAIPWSVSIAGGIAKAEMDLRALRLSRFESRGGAAKATLRLGGPEGIVPIRINGGAASLVVTHPPGVGVRLRVGGGATLVTLDDQSLGAVGGGLTLSNRAWDEKGNGFDVKIAGGAARVDVHEEDRTE